MNCPSCGVEDYYYGINGSSCINSVCVHYTPGNKSTNIITFSVKKKSFGWWVGTRIWTANIHRIEPELLCYGGKVPVLVYEKDPTVAILRYDADTSWAGFINDLSVAACGGIYFSGKCPVEKDDDPHKAIDKVLKKKPFITLDPPYFREDVLGIMRAKDEKF